MQSVAVRPRHSTSEGPVNRHQPTHFVLPDHQFGLSQRSHNPGIQEVPAKRDGKGHERPSQLRREPIYSA